MNIKDILRQAGYDIMEERITDDINGWRHQYDLRITLEGRQVIKRRIDKGLSSYDIDIDAIHTVYVDELGLNGSGDLYVCLNYCHDDSCFDGIEFNNGKCQPTYMLASVMAGDKVHNENACSSQDKCQVPVELNPYEIYYNTGSPGLYTKLSALDTSELKAVIACFLPIPLHETINIDDNSILIDKIVREIKEIANRGAAFGDYTLPD